MTRKYNVYGIGNALVDIQYQVSPELLERMGIAKGGMTLIDADRRLEIVTALAGIPVRQSSGGSAANTMIGVANLGGRAFYACTVGQDPEGDFYLGDLAAAGVAANPEIRGTGPTGQCLVMITPDADRTMNTFLGVSSAFGPSQIDAAVIGQSDYFYIEGYLLSLDQGFEAVLAGQRCARQSGTRVALTLSDVFIVNIFKERIRQIISAGVDLLFCNESEARAYTGCDKTGPACAALLNQTKQCAVTCGPDGALIGHAGMVIRSPGFKVRAIDTNGAGDLFAGAFLYGITHGYDPAKAARLATYASSKIVTRFGPRLEESLRGQDEKILALKP